MAGETFTVQRKAPNHRPQKNLAIRDRHRRDNGAGCLAHGSWLLKPSTRGPFRARHRCRKNSGGNDASAQMRRHLMTAPFLQRSAQIKIISLQTKSPGSDGAKSELMITDHL